MIENYLLDIEIQKGLSKNTVLAYKKDLEDIKS